MFETSKDLLFIVLAFSILWLTIFVSWTIYYVAMILKQVNSTMKKFTGVLEKIEALTDFIKEKVDKSSNYFAILLTGAKQVMDYFGNREAEEKKTRKNKK